MQKSVYRVRTLANLTGRMAVDLFRDAGALDRGQIIQWLHQARAGPARYAAR